MYSKITYITLPLVIFGSQPACIRHPVQGTELDAHDGSCYGKDLNWDHDGSCSLPFLCQDARINAGHSFTCASTSSCYGASIEAGHELSCTGRLTCANAVLSAGHNMRCVGSGSYESGTCQGSTINGVGHDFECTGTAACMGVSGLSVGHDWTCNGNHSCADSDGTAGHDVECKGVKACSGGNVYAGHDVNCDGGFACQTAQAGNNVNCNGESTCALSTAVQSGVLLAGNHVICDGRSACEGQKISAGNTLLCKGADSCKAATVDEVMTLACESNESCGDDFAGVVHGSPLGFRYFCDQLDGCGTLQYQCHGSSETSSFDLTFTGATDMCRNVRVICPGVFAPCSDPDDSGLSKPQTGMAIAFSMCAAFLLCCCCYTVHHKRVARERMAADQAIVARFPTVDGDIEQQGFRLGGDVTPSGEASDVAPATPGERAPLGEDNVPGYPGFKPRTPKGYFPKSYPKVNREGELTPMERQDTAEAARIGEPSPRQYVPPQLS